jgi:hypothetical protein
MYDGGCRHWNGGGQGQCQPRILDGQRHCHARCMAFKRIALRRDKTRAPSAAFASFACSIILIKSVRTAYCATAAPAP